MKYVSVRFGIIRVFDQIVVVFFFTLEVILKKLEFSKIPVIYTIFKNDFYYILFEFIYYF